MKDNIEKLTRECIGKIALCANSKELYEQKVVYLGKSGLVTLMLKDLKNVEPAQKPAMGKLLNDARIYLEEQFSLRQNQIDQLELSQKLAAEKVDISINQDRQAVGKLHPLNLVLKKAIDFFVSLGFSVEESREIETPYYNFDALNTAKDHPARDAQDTFFIDEDTLLRSQTSTGQIRTMEKRNPPIKMISPGRVFRADETDATHTPCFHQLEGLVIGKGVNMCQLKGILTEFAQYFFSKDTKIRFRPSFFPFTEPSVEVDASCPSCGGDGCRVCKNTGFIEILGAGMVNRNVLLNVGINPDVYTGFAFGVGLDRITAIIYGINDARISFEGDIRFLKQF